jgi:hypothetical protein
MQLWKKRKWEIGPVLPAMRKQDRKSHVTKKGLAPSRGTLGYRPLALTLTG